MISRLVPGSDWHSVVVEQPWVRILGLAILLGSTAFTLWARVALGTMWSSSPTVKIEHQLRTDGPYAVTRHPIYTGLLGIMLGTVLLVGLGIYTLRSLNRLKRELATAKKRRRTAPRVSAPSVPAATG